MEEAFAKYSIPKDTVLGLLQGIECTDNELKHFIKEAKKQTKSLEMVRLDFLMIRDPQIRKQSVDGLPGYENIKYLFVLNPGSDCNILWLIQNCNPEEANVEYVYGEWNGWPKCAVITTKNIEKNETLKAFKAPHSWTTLNYKNKKCNWISCNKEGINLRECSGCSSVYYCSKICQKKDWILTKSGNTARQPHKYCCK